MDLYFAPLACSMATRIALYEAGADAQLHLSRPTKRLPDGSDFLQINPLGMVPALRTDEGDLLTENGAILQYVAERFPARRSRQRDGIERARLQQWLSFIGTELHKAIFIPLLDPKAPEAVKAYALGLAAALRHPRETSRRPRIPARHVQPRRRVSLHGAELDARDAARSAEWPAVKAYHDRMRKRPSIAKALAEELVLYTRSRRAARRRSSGYRPGRV